MQCVKRVDWQWKTQTLEISTPLQQPLSYLSFEEILKKSFQLKASPHQIEPLGLKPFSEPFGNFDLLEITQQPAHCFVFPLDSVKGIQDPLPHLVSSIQVQLTQVRNLFEMRTCYSQHLQLNFRALMEESETLLTNLIWIVKSCWPKSKPYLSALRKELFWYGNHLANMISPLQFHLYHQLLNKNSSIVLCYSFYTLQYSLG